jgi:hypothetical protein
MQLLLVADRLENLTKKILFSPLRQIINLRSKSKIASLTKNTDNLKIEIGSGAKKGENDG